MSVDSIFYAAVIYCLGPNILKCGIVTVQVSLLEFISNIIRTLGDQGMASNNNVRYYTAVLCQKRGDSNKLLDCLGHMIDYMYICV